MRKFLTRVRAIDAHRGAETGFVKLAHVLQTNSCNGHREHRQDNRGEKSGHNSNSLPDHMLRNLNSGSAHPPHIHTLHKPKHCAVHDQTRAAIRNKWHRQTGHGRDSEGHTDVLEHLPQHHREYSGTDVCTYRVLREACNPPNSR